MSQRRTSDEAFDQRMMRRAIALARRGEGRVEPNPMVGCVIARNGRVIGEGFHRRFGGPHAEIEALRACLSHPRGADVYVSLEPCCHVGKTPPCTEALIDARVRRVVVARRDPNRCVSGRGFRSLRRAGIRVETGLLHIEASAVLAPYLTRETLDRPYIIAKWAQSLDGKLATRTGDSRWISGERSRRSVHRLRARVDGVLVGSETVLKDDPMLTARDVPVRRRALRIVLDRRLRTPATCQLVATAGDIPTLIVTANRNVKSARALRLTRKGVEVVGCPVTKRGLSLSSCMRRLAQRQVTNLLVEGGAEVLTSFLAEKLVDEALVFVAPKLIGGRAAPCVLPRDGARRIQDALTARVVRVNRSGDDQCYRMWFTRFAPPAPR